MKQKTSKKEPTKIAIDRSQWSEESRRTYEDREFYTTMAWTCRGCGLESVFTAQTQKQAFEQEKVYIHWRPVLCDGCKQRKQALADKIYRYEARWAANKQELKTDIEFLTSWLASLEAYAQLSRRRSHNVIQMLQALIRTGYYK